jgi:6-pyruvoyltetrahydropterin/6-carboxytetrahydropterin synthase
MYSLSVHDTFSAAHFLRDYKGKCENLHGHNWKVQVTVRGPHPDKSSGMLVDFGIIKKALKKSLDTLDHRNLNEDVDFFRIHNPSAENLACHIFGIIRKELADIPGCAVAAVTVHETDTSACTYTED